MSCILNICINSLGMHRASLPFNFKNFILHAITHFVDITRSVIMTRVPVRLCRVYRWHERDSQYSLQYRSVSRRSMSW